MLAKVYHLTTNSEFEAVKKNGKRYSSLNFTLSAYRRESGDYPRFGFIIPNKIMPRAVDRNRIKRVLSEGVRFQLSYVSPLFDIVFLPKVSILRAYTHDVMREVGEALKHAKTLKKEV